MSPQILLLESKGSLWTYPAGAVPTILFLLLPLHFLHITPDINFSSVICYKVCISHITAPQSQHKHSWNYTPAFSWPHSTLVMLNSAAYSLSVVWFKLNPHFWRELTTFVLVRETHDSAMKCTASATFKFMSVGASCSNLQPILYTVFLASCLQ